MKPAVEFARFAPGAACWHAYDPVAKVELWSTALAVENGALLIDPIALDRAALAELRAALGEPRAVVLTNGNHERASAIFGVPVFAGVEAVRADVVARWPEIGVIPLPGAGENELALTFAPLRLAIVGDAVINLDDHGFIPLPAKYCAAPKQARRSLRQLLDYAPEMLAFAHGSPIVAGATQRLQSLPL